MGLIEQLKEDLRAALERDPSQRGVLEALTASPGLLAVLGHRVTHRLWRRDLFLVARWGAMLVRWFTGADLHPAAQLGRRVVIDHGAGVVIGQTAEVGDDVLLFQGVTLGGVGGTRHKRHPTLDPRVVVGPGAVLLGSICVGADARIAAGSVVVRDVPERGVAVGVPARVMARSEVSGEVDLAHDLLPDPVVADIEELRRELADLRARLDGLTPGQES